MIQRTFQHIPGVGPWREKDLWARGIRTWDDFPLEGAPTCISKKVDLLARTRIEQARDALQRKDLRFLAELIPGREHWRLYNQFAEECAFFDIETDGTESQTPTVVSVLDGAGIHVFVRGRNLEQLPERLAGSKVWVTFNGSCFDIPMLRRFFGLSFPTPLLHLDLRFIVRKIGLSGGLKQIENRVGIGRPLHLQGVNGMEAVTLWRNHLINRDDAALRLLIEYNIYDSIQLKSLMDIVYNQAAERLRCDVPARTVFSRGEILYDVSRSVLQWAPI